MEGQYSDKVMDHFRNPRNVGEIPDASGIGNVGNPVCVTGETLVNCNSSIKTINEIERETRVLGHDGLYHVVKDLHRRYYRNPMVKLDVHNLGSVTLTPDHHVLAVKTRDYSHKFYQSMKDVPDWYNAAELKKGDTILYPIPKDEKDIFFIEMDEPKLKFDYKGKELPQRIAVTDEFLRLVGYYLAEGYVRTDRCKGAVGFVFGSREEEFVEDVAHAMNITFGLDAGGIRRVHNSINIVFYSARLARFFKRLFGKGAAKKKIPHELMILPAYKQRSLICGMWHGDGCLNEKCAKYVTISRQLAYQVRSLLLRQRIMFSFLTVAEKGVHKENYHIYVKEGASLKKLAEMLKIRINRPAKKKNPHKCWIDNNFFYTTVRKAGRTIHNGMVYNLEVDSCHSYVAGAAILHNCGDIMRLYIKVDENEVITDAKFKTFGCGAAISTSSMVTELVKGKTIEEALKVSNHAVAEALGGLPKIKMHCSVLAEEALKSAIEDYLKKKHQPGD